MIFRRIVPPHQKLFYASHYRYAKFGTNPRSLINTKITTFYRGLLDNSRLPLLIGSAPKENDVTLVSFRTTSRRNRDAYAGMVWTLPVLSGCLDGARLSFLRWPLWRHFFILSGRIWFDKRALSRRNCFARIKKHVRYSRNVLFNIPAIASIHSVIFLK